MKGFECQTCGFMAIDGAAPDRCPVCFSPKTSFEEKDAINAKENEGKEKHVPVIEVADACIIGEEGCKDIVVKVGSVLHPMEADHYITFIDYYLDKKFISRIHLTPGNLNPGAVIFLKADSGKVTVIEKCNKHGNWINEVDL